MSTLTPTRKVSRKHELREDKVVTLYARVLRLIDTNRTVVYAAFGVIVLAVALYFGLSYMQSAKNTEALDAMTEAVRLYEGGEYTRALDGDMFFAGLIEVADQYGNTQAGNLARFYAADALFRSGDLVRALSYFQSFDKGANYIGASAYAGEAAIHETNGDFDQAADLFLRAANVFESAVTSPTYLIQAGRAYEDAGDTDAARQMYERLKEDYPTSRESQDADFYLARLGR